MAYYTGPTGNSIASSNVNKKNKTYNSATGQWTYGTSTTNKNSNGTNANKSKTTTNSSYDASRNGPSYGGMGENASTGKSSGSGSSSSGSGGSGGSYSSSTYEEYVAPEEYVPEFNYSSLGNSLLEEYTKSLTRAAEEAYNRSMDLVNGYYNTAKGNLEKNYNESIGTLDRNNAQNTSAINADAEEALRQAYINNMLSRKSLQQAMTAQGLNGGATETTRASLENNYGNARNSIDTTRNRNLADLLSQYQNNLAGIRQQYNTGLSELDANKLNYAMQINSDLQDRLSGYIGNISDFINNALASDNPMNVLNATWLESDYAKALNNYNRGNIAADLGVGTNNYVNALQNLAANSSNFNLTPSEVINTYDPSSMQQAGMYANSNYARALAEQQALAGATPGATNTTIGGTGNVTSLAQILKALASQYGA